MRPTEKVPHRIRSRRWGLLPTIGKCQLRRIPNWKLPEPRPASSAIRRSARPPSSHGIDCSARKRSAACSTWRTTNLKSIPIWCASEKSGLSDVPSIRLGPGQALRGDAEVATVRFRAGLNASPPVHDRRPALRRRSQCANTAPAQTTAAAQEIAPGDITGPQGWICVAAPCTMTGVSTGSRLQDHDHAE